MIELLGDRLKELRTISRYSQSKVASIIGVNKKQISAYENNIRQPSYDILLRFASLYRVSTDYLLGYTDERTLNISALSRLQAYLISELVYDMSKRNANTEDDEENDDEDQ